MPIIECPTSHSNTRKRAVAVALAASLAVLLSPGTGHAQDGGQDKVTLCHQTGDGSYVTITVSESAAENGHGNHEGDIIPAPPGGCPTGTPAPETGPSQTPPAPGDQTPPAPGKVLVCHMTSDGGYTVINIAQAGWDNGHSQHEGDILLLEGAGTESCEDARKTLDLAAFGVAGVAGVDVRSLVPAVPAVSAGASPAPQGGADDAASPLPNTGVEHTVMTALAAMMLLAGTGLVAVSKRRVMS